MIDITNLYNLYIDENAKIDLEKANILESFRNVEANFKYYEDALNVLEKEKNKASIDAYERLSNEVIQRLSNFNPEDIHYNIPPIQKEIEYLIEVRDDVSNTNQKFKHIISMWNAFLDRNPELDLSSIFIKSIIDDIEKIKEEFVQIDLNNLPRIEENIIDLTHSVERVITMIEELNKLVDANDFIGKEPQMLKRSLEKFTTEGYKKMTLLEINDFYKKSEAKIHFYQQKILLKRVKAKVIKVISKEDPNIYNYGIELNGVLLYVSDKLTDNEVLEDTKEYLYIDNFPVYGIIPVTMIQDKIEVADDQFYANKALNDTSIKLFIVTILASVGVLSMTIAGNLTPFISVPLVGLFAGIFVFLFKGLKYNINSRYNLPNMFYFFKVSYMFVKIGDDGLNVQNVVPSILMNFSKIVSNEASLKRELNDRRLVRQSEEEKRKQEENNKKESFFKKLFGGKK